MVCFIRRAGSNILAVIFCISTNILLRPRFRCVLSLHPSIYFSLALSAFDIHTRAARHSSFRGMAEAKDAGRLKAPPTAAKLQPQVPDELLTKALTVREEKKRGTESSNGI